MKLKEHGNELGSLGVMWDYYVYVYVGLSQVECNKRKKKFLTRQRNKNILFFKFCDKKNNKNLNHHLVSLSKNA